MTRGQRMATWSALCAIGVGVAAYSTYIGVDKSEKLWGIIGGVAGLITMILAAYQIIATQSGETRKDDIIPARQSQKSGKRSVNLQAGRDLKIGDKNSFGDRDD
jgi:hypothetical protein